jgi:hypothetical protein
MKHPTIDDIFEYFFQKHDDKVFVANRGGPVLKGFVTNLDLPVLFQNPEAGYSHLW